MTREYTGIDQSVTKAEIAVEDLVEPNGIALQKTKDGVKLPEAGGDIYGLAIISNDDSVKKGERIDVQIKDIGLWQSGDVFEAGDLLATDAAGKCVKAASGNYIVGRAMQSAAAPDELVQVRLINVGAKLA